jgi:uncharacterized membrane protein YoaK (UPF0700 family)
MNWKRFYYQTIGFILGSIISLLWTDFLNALSIFISLVLASFIVNFHEHQTK